MQKKQGKTILAIDPSIVKLGWAVISGPEPLEIIATGVIKTKRKEQARISEIALEIRDILQKYTEVEALVIETQFLSSVYRGNAVLKTTEAKGAVVGMFTAESESEEPEVFEVNPAQVKKVVGIKGRMKRKESKEIVTKMIRQFFNRANLTEDECDALAMGLVYFNHQLVCSPQ